MNKTDQLISAQKKLLYPNAPVLPLLQYLKSSELEANVLALQRNKLFQQAIILYDIACEKFGNHLFYNRRGNVYFSIGEYEKGLNDVVKALQIDHDDRFRKMKIADKIGMYNTIYRIAKQYHTWQSIIDAYKILSEDLEIDRLLLNINVAIAYTKLGDKDKGRNLIQEIENIEIFDENLVKSIANNIWDVGFQETAIKFLENKIQKFKKNVDLLSLLCIFYMKLCEYSKAYQLIQQILKKQLLNIQMQNYKNTIDEYCEKLNLNIEKDNVLMPDCSYTAIYNKAIQNYQPLEPKKLKKIILVVANLGAGGSEKNAVMTAVDLKKNTKIRHISVLANSLKNDYERFFYQPLINEKIDCYTTGDNCILSDKLKEKYSQYWLYIESLSPVWRRDFLYGLINHFDKNRPDIVHSLAGDERNILVALAALITNIPIINLNPGGLTPLTRYGLDSERTFLIRHMKCGYNLLFNNKNITISHCSENARQDYIDWISRQPNNSSVILYGQDIKADIGQKKIKQLKKTLNINKKNIVIGGIFRFNPDKDPIKWIQTAIETCKKDSRIIFVHCGNSTENAIALSVRSIWEKSEFKDRIILCGEKTDLDIYYQLFDLMLLTSNNEGLGNVLIEAQANGTPIIATNVGGIPETILEGKTGFLVDKNDSPATIANKIIETLNNKEFMKDIQNKTRAFIAEKFYPNRLLDDTLKSYEIKI